MSSQITTVESNSFQPAAGAIREETTAAAPHRKNGGAEKQSKTQILCEQAINRLADAVEKGESEAIKTYLGVMARFHQYSFCNQLLILAPRPDATHVAGYQRWQALGRQVQKGEKGIQILAPIPAKLAEEPEQEQETAPHHLCGFRAVYVFDVAQTTGKTLPEAPQAQGDPGNSLAVLKAFYTKQGIALEYKPSLGGPEGVSTKGKVYVLSGLNPAREFSVLVHELAHELLHGADRRKELDRKVLETEAEAVAYVVGLATGLDMNTASADYISLYKGNRDTLRASFEAIARTAARIIAALTETN